jgi:transcription initiation factor TFIIE subunit alpha
MAKKKQRSQRKKKVFRISKKIRDFVITELAGEDVLPIVEYLKGKENVSEFVIAKDLEDEINLTRNKLYRLLQANLVSFTRKKDKQKGWYIYYWTLKLDDVKFLYYDIKRKKLERLQERVKREENNHFFICMSRCIRLDFEQAISFDYHCPECGELLHQEDNEKIIREVKKDIEVLQKEVDGLKAAL